MFHSQRLIDPSGLCDLLQRAAKLEKKAMMGLDVDETDEERDDTKGLQALILAPTRELAIQVRCWCQPDLGLAPSLFFSVRLSSSFPLPQPLHTGEGSHCRCREIYRNPRCGHCWR